MWSTTSRRARAARAVSGAPAVTDEERARGALMAAKDTKKEAAKKPRIDWNAKLAPVWNPLRRVLRILLPTATGTLLIALGLFFAWQAYLVHTQEAGAAEADTVRAAVIAAVGKEIAEREAKVQAATESP